MIIEITSCQAFHTSNRLFMISVAPESASNNLGVVNIPSHDSSAATKINFALEDKQ